MLGVINSGDTAWVLVSAALVMFMTPGLALFYGGMVRAKNVLAMLMQNFFSLGLVSVLWAIVVYSLAFGGTNEVDRQLRVRLARQLQHRAAGHHAHDPAVAVHGVPNDVRGDHARADHRRDRGSHAIRGVGVVPRAVGRARVRARCALGVRAGGLARPTRRARLRGGHRRAHQRRYRRARGRASCSDAVGAGRTRRCRRTRCRSR